MQYNKKHTLPVLPLMATTALFCISCSSSNNSVELKDNVEPTVTQEFTEPSTFYSQDGYQKVDLLQVHLKTVISQGLCNEDDITGCTLEDVYNDNNSTDDFKPKVAVHLLSSDYPEDSLISNAKLKQRGDTSRDSDQKSYSVKLDTDITLWRNERRLQLNKHPFDQERIRNKLSFDLMINVEHLNSLRTQFVQLFIEDNGQETDYGLFTHVERIGKNYTANRGYEADSPIYKAVNFNFSRYEDRIQIDAEGKPIDKDQFERNLEIEEGDDHRTLVNMLDALNSPDSDKALIISKHFDDENLTSWLATNILLGNRDTVYENYFLFNPKGTEKFYFIPWDYDGAFKTENHPDLYEDQQQIKHRLGYGIGRWWSSVLTQVWLSQPGAYNKLSQRVEELRSGPLNDTAINDLINAYRPVIQPVLMASPDISALEGDTPADKLAEWNSHIGEMSGRVETNYQQFINTDLSWPMPVNYLSAETSGTSTTFNWTPSFDFEGDPINYRVELSTTIDFTNIIYEKDSIPHSPITNAGSLTKISHTANTGTLESGRTYYWRVFSYDSTDPENTWRPGDGRIGDQFGLTSLTVN